MTKISNPPLTGAGHALVVPTGQLNLYHLNPRVGNVDAIAASLQHNAQYRPIVVNEGKQTGRPFEVLAGNHTLLAARQLNWTTIQTWLIDVDDEQAKRIVLADNKTADLAGYVDDVLTELLSSLDDLAGTGYTDEELGRLIAGPGAPGSADDYADGTEALVENQFGVIVLCTDEADQAKVYEELHAQGRELRVVTV